MDGDKTYHRKRFVLGKLECVKGELRIPKVQFLSYCEKSPLIQLTQSGPLRAWPKLEVFSGVMVEKFIIMGIRL